MRSPALLVLLLLLPSVASAEVYKWKDASGRVHYSDQPHSDSASVIKSGPSQAEQATTSQRDMADKDLAFRKRQEELVKEKGKASKEAETARIKRENCDRARKNLDAMNKSTNIYTTGPNGERVYMSDQQQAETRAMSEKAITENCR